MRRDKAALRRLVGYARLCHQSSRCRAGRALSANASGRGGAGGRCRRPGGAAAAVLPPEAAWDADRVNGRRLELLRMQEATSTHSGGAIVIDDSGDRKDGRATAHLGRQWLGRLGKTDNGVVTVTTVWTDGRIDHPLHAQPYAPAHHFDRGRGDPGFRTKPQISAALAVRGKEAGFACRAVVADCAYSTSDDWYFALRDAGLPYVVALKPHHGTWPAPMSRTPRSTPPTRWSAPTPAIRTTGGPSSATSATGKPRFGGPATPAWAATAPTAPAA
ncbi:transposase [Streptomyces sp. WAC 01325]|uniref:IS701 family transposase n=1 Tax=Streptomyces sp. WAC 01325 TaxID=2203202 RepID=UPI000F86857C|nr:transposase [Streptomyces sp. WAC 01325]RSN18775.1 transposase [Streptomyces sp. WAC 01325]